MKKILIANRGEIASRIMRTASKMGIRTVAVFSGADRKMPFVREADEAVCIGPAPSNQSYLDIDKIIKVAKSKKVDAIHPGYGFLSENASFSAAVQEAGFTFIGPGPEAIEMMGDKLAAREVAEKAGVPLVPGTKSAVTDPEEAMKFAIEIGFPVIIKAAAGGGGKGMRIVKEKGEFASQMKRATSEALNAFGNGAVFVEKYIENPKHIEIQILADKNGKAISLLERECSVQRRHQKVIEEAPSPIVDTELRRRMGDDAVRLAEICGYESAGTVEFIMDEEKKYYFLEMNTRLQVEHPVTELITGIDLVAWQIRIARGEMLDMKQHEIKPFGHSIELRVYAEDPTNDFLPSTGTLSLYQPPKGENIRVDDGYEQGLEVPVYYDPMLSKLIVWGKNRDEAIAQMLKAISEYMVEGVATTLPFGKFAIDHPAFRDGTFTTKFVEQYFRQEKLIEANKSRAFAAALIGLHHYTKTVNTYRPIKRTN
ncbi:MAG: acetyl-CoA carboxylase biotin carboxylase subunit [Saprospirales bacterium]|nr:MAG: acetyl-CoA carboxylase biotin carboxylase subunit [Saprospirales bacterium]